MSVVPLQPHDAQRLRRLRLRALEDAPLAFGSTLEETRARPPQDWVQQLRTLPTFVAEQDGEDVGMVRAARDPGSPGRAWLISMWVAPQARGRGVGVALIQQIIDWARAQGLAEIALDVADDNAPAVALYERMGFAANGVTGSLPPPREHVLEHQRVFTLGATP